MKKASESNEKNKFIWTFGAVLFLLMLFTIISILSGMSSKKIVDVIQRVKGM